MRGAKACIGPDRAQCHRVLAFALAMRERDTAMTVRKPLRFLPQCQLGGLPSMRIA